ncbi:MAG TPA: cystathionine gamma-synthase [Candidatus Dormibacteraeota bacterium]|nr:cystathionine gamma-synthase [Candidatus Dormibacteraeota bacterium]
MTSPGPGFETRAIHVGQDPDPMTGSVVPAVHLSTTYQQSSVGHHQGFEYSRSGNPNRQSLEAQLASLEGAQFGFAFASGLSAEDAVLRAMLSPQAHLVLNTDAYGGTFRLVDRVHAPAGLAYSVADATDPAELVRAWRDNTSVVWVETPSNPLLAIIDINEVAQFAHTRGARLVVDNTFATPYLQNPLSLGADLVVHSTTKYLGGHSDVVGGFVAVNDPELAAGIAFLQNATGAVPSPLDCYLVQRGVKTLAVRMDRHCRNAASVADFLRQHPMVSRVLYPGLQDHPGHEVASRQMREYGGMVSFLHAGGEAAAVEMVSLTRVFTLAESLGAVESLIEHPARMTHASAADSPLAVDPHLVRLSVGLELVDDLIADLDQALDR